MRIAFSPSSDPGATRGFPSLIALSLLLLSTCPLFAAHAGPQEDEPAAPVEQEVEESKPSLAEALSNLKSALAAKKLEIDAKLAELQDAADETTRASSEAELEGLHEDRIDLEARFARLASQSDGSLFVDAPPAPFDPKDKVLGLLKPVFDELDEMTSNSREISQLEEDLVTQQARLQDASKAVKNLEELSAQELEADVRAGVDELLKVWSSRMDAAEAQLSSIEYELGERRAQQRPLVDTVSSFVRGFVRTRGFHLLMGVLAFCVVFFGLRGFMAIVRKIRPTPKKKRLTDRLVALLTHALSILLGIGAVLFVFNATGDWFLLGLSLFFLAGFAWVIAKALPQYVEQIRLVLNMGAVREGELLVFNDVPWRVQTIGFQAQLVSERLSGGLQVLPVRDLVGLHSRPLGEGEGLFPCRKGDWVSLDDGTTGRVELQTPRVVQLGLLGGARKNYSIGAFLGQNPQNMSSSYRVEFTFGIDYKHQKDCTGSIPEAMQVKLRTGLLDVLEESELVEVDVEFKAAAASSLDYEVQIDVDGAAAAKYEDVERAAARLLVDACNENDWEIPFQQLTVHQAVMS